MSARKMTAWEASELLDDAIEYLTKSRMRDTLEEQDNAVDAALLIVILPSPFAQQSDVHLDQRRVMSLISEKRVEHDRRLEQKQ